jgi:DNA primase
VRGALCQEVEFRHALYFFARPLRDWQVKKLYITKGARGLDKRKNAKVETSLPGMSDIDEIKSRLNIVDVIGKYVKLKKTGRNFKGLCPFHNEKTPSFIVSPERQIFHCFGCGKGGTIFDFIMDYTHVDFVEALEELADLAGVKLTRRIPSSPEANLKQKLYEVNHLASEFYHYILTKHALGKKGLLYLKNRGITDKSIKTFTLGYSPNSWDGLYKFLRKKGYEDAIMEKAGLVLPRQSVNASERQYYDRFRGRVMFTLRDHRGNVVGFAGRVLDPDAKEAKYINTSETPVYVKSSVLYGLDVTKDAIQKANEAVIMEGELDVISSFQAGIGNAVAIKGSALTDGHVRLLRRFTERILFALDADLAGDAAARRGIEIADAAGLDMKVVNIPSGKDPDEAARENPALLKKAIEEAMPVYDYFISSALSRFDGASAFGKKKIGEELSPVLAKIENPIVRNHYIKKVAAAIDTSEQAIEDNIERARRGMPAMRGEEAEFSSQSPALTRPEKLEIYILALLLQGKTVELFEELQEEGMLPEFVRPAVHKIINHLLAYLFPKGEKAGKPVFLVKDFVDTLPPELVPTLDEAFLWDIADFISDDELFAREWLRAMEEFKKVTLRRKIHELTKKIASSSQAEKLQKELKALTQALKSLEKSS